MFLCEFEEKGYNLEILKSYNEFLIDCSKKDYVDVETQKHHILPRFMGGSNREQNLISLSLGDHFYAHLKLAECFDPGSKEKIGNVSSCNQIQGITLGFLRKKIDKVPKDLLEFWETANKLLKGMFAGENNHMFGKCPERTREHIEKWHDGRRKYMKEKYPWPEWVFPCNDIINGSQKKSYRFCCKCDDKIYSTKRPNSFETEKPYILCSECRIERNKEKVRKSILEKQLKDNTFNNISKHSRATMVLNLETDEVYYSLAETYYKTGLSSYKFDIELKNGKFLKLGRTNVRTP